MKTDRTAYDAQYIFRTLSRIAMGSLVTMVILHVQILAVG